MTHHTGSVPETEPARAAKTRAYVRRGLDLRELADEKFADRFWSKVDPTGDCWLWTAYTKPDGYGQFTVRKGKFYNAHAVSYALTAGPVPPGMVVCHRCDNPPCVNPDHLFLGTHRDNMHDMSAKGRAVHSRGEQQHNARLSEADVREIKSFPERRGLRAELARRYGVSHTTITKIRSGLKWVHVR